MYILLSSRNGMIKADDDVALRWLKPLEISQFSLRAIIAWPCYDHAKQQASKTVVITSIHHIESLSTSDRFHNLINVRNSAYVALCIHRVLGTELLPSSIMHPKMSFKLALILCASLSSWNSTHLARTDHHFCMPTTRICNVGIRDSFMQIVWMSKT